MLRYLWRLIYPRECAMCERPLNADEEDICPACMAQLPRTEHANHRENITEQLFAEMNKLVRAGSFCFYPHGHAYRNTIQNLKFGDRPEVGYLLGKTAAMEWGKSGFFEGIDYIVPLPLHKDRLRQRGYNQAEYIAKGISEVTGIPLDTTHLVRQVNNDKQSEKMMRDRRQLGNVFAMQNPSDWRGKHILLVDDVITSGTTMQRAMETLQPIRQCRYSAFSLAVASGNTQSPIARRAINSPQGDQSPITNHQ